MSQRAGCAMREPSELEAAFVTLWRTLGGPELQREFRFAPARRWRFDFAEPASRIAIELEGGTWSNGRHNRPQGFAADCIKYNAAALAGWRLFRFTADMLRDDPAGHLLPVINLITWSGP